MIWKLLLTSCLLFFSSETQLKRDLLTGYSKSSKEKEVNLNLGVAFRSINKIDQIEETIESNIWLRHYWKDSRLTWDPANYSNMTSVVFPTDPELEESIWTPDVYLYNTAEEPMGNLDYSRAMVDYKGDVIWSRPGMLKSTCVFDLSRFPYDIQNCYLKFGSWGYHSGEMSLDLHDPPVDMENFQHHQGWVMEELGSEIKMKKYGCCPELYPSAHFNFQIQRKSGYYTLNIVMPAFATATLMIISMLIPWDSGERISFAATVMLSLIVFLLILSDSLPKTDTKPLLSIMLIGLMFFSLIVVLFTVLITALRKVESDSKRAIKLMEWLKKFKIFKSCSGRERIRSRRESYIGATTVTTITEECSGVANVLENYFTITFFFSFVIFSIVVLTL